MIGWTKLNPTTTISPAFACKISKIFTADGVEKNQPVHIHVYIDDMLLLGYSKQQILMKLATLIEAFFVVMGELDT